MVGYREPLSHMNAMVLHRRAYRETSYIVDFFTRETGKISAVCKGVRGKKSDKKSLLQPFQQLVVNLVGRHELKNLSGLEPTGVMLTLSGDKLFSAMYLNELLNRTLLPEVAYSNLYDLYLASLVRLADKQSIEPVLREFEFNLLDELGYRVELGHDWRNEEALDLKAYYTFLSQHGIQKLDSPDQTRNCFAGADLNKVLQNQWDSESLKCAKMISRMALHPLLGSKPLKSRELFQQLEQMK